MGNVTLKGPNRLGAAELDEGALTAAVVGVYAQEDGSRGQEAAARVRPARLALWRAAELHLPRELAAGLRARLAQSDQTGRDGVRELRAALADWLDPPPLCAHCRRGIAAGTEMVACPARPQRTWAGRGRHPGPSVCLPRRGPQGLRGGAAMARSVARAGALPLFSPLQVDPACAAAARLVRHGAAAYDLVVDRDARTLLEVTGANARELHDVAHGIDRLLPVSQARGAVPNAYDAAVKADPVPEQRLSGHLGCIGNVQDAARRTGGEEHRRHTSTTPVAAARRAFDRAMNDAIKANGPLILKCQLRQYSPNGSATRADLVQGAAMGLRRALLDYDPAVARFSTYAIHWARQGGGESFAARDLVAVPDWAIGLRRAVEERDLLPAQLLRLIGAVAETRPLLVGEHDAPQRPSKSKATKPHHEHHVCEVASDLHDTSLSARRRSLHIEAVAELARYAGLEQAVVLPATPASKGVAARPAQTLVPATTLRAVCAALMRAAAKPEKAKNDTGDERARERVAAYVAGRLGLRAGKKAVTGGALLTALRSGAAVVVGIGTGDHDDAGGGSEDGAGHGAGRSERLPEHLADESPDPEEAAAEEDEARREMAALLGALEALRVEDPEAAEVVRRRHAMDALGDPETFEQIASAPLHCTGRSRCREGVRQAYERGKQALRRAAPALLARLPADVGHETATPPIRRESAPTQPLAQVQVQVGDAVEVRPRQVHIMAAPRSYEFHDRHASTLMLLTNEDRRPTPEEFGQWAAGRDAMMAAF